MPTPFSKKVDKCYLAPIVQKTNEKFKVENVDSQVDNEQDILEPSMEIDEGSDEVQPNEASDQTNDFDESMETSAQPEDNEEQPIDEDSKKSFIYQIHSVSRALPVGVSLQT